MAYVNGEWLDQEEDQSNPLAGLASTSTPGRQGSGMSEAYKAYETPGWESNVNSMGLNPNWDTLKKAGQANNISPEDWSKGFQYYNDNITPFAGNSEWWGQDAMTRAGMQGYAGANPNANFNWSQYSNPQQEAQQQKAQADAGMARQNKGGDDLFGSLLPLLLVGGLGLATGGFGFGAGAGLGGAAEAGIYGASGLGAGSAAWSAPSIAGGLAADNAIMAGFGSGVMGAGSSAGDWAGDFGGGGGAESLPVGGGGVDPSVSFPGGGSDPGLYDLFNQGGLDFEGAGNFLGGGDPGANTMFGTSSSSATNLEQALNMAPNQPVPNVDIPQTVDTFNGYNPETATSIDQVSQAGLDSTAPIREAGVNASIPDQARLGLKGLNQMTSSPYFQVPKTLYNLYSQNQKAKVLENMMSKFQQQSDVGAPFRDLMMRSYNDPNFFKGMPEFGAGMDAFNQQYGATAAQKGMRSQLGGAAHNIAVNREGSRLADIYRSRIGPLAGMQPNMQGQAALAPTLANAQGNQLNSLFDPQLWNSLKDFF